MTATKPRRQSSKPPSAAAPPAPPAQPFRTQLPSNLCIPRGKDCVADVLRPISVTTFPTATLLKVNSNSWGDGREALCPLPPPEPHDKNHRHFARCWNGYAHGRRHAQTVPGIGRLAHSAAHFAASGVLRSHHRNYSGHARR